MRSTRFLSFVLIALTGWVCMSEAHAVELETRVERSAVAAGETFQLLLRCRGSAFDVEPDLTPLERDFDIVSVQQAMRTSIINGRRDQSLDWIVTLAPRGDDSAETLTIPAITVGAARSTPTEIRIVQAASGSDIPSQSIAYVEAEVDQATPYVQGKVVLTVRVFAGDEVLEGALSEPDVPGAMIERLGDDTTYETVQEGQTFRVIERRYSLFPQESGALRISPFVFEARVNDRSGRARQPFSDPFADPFGGSPFAGMGMGMGSSLFDDMFGRGKQVRVRSNDLELEVLERPDGAAGSWWLPATKVELLEQWDPEVPTFRVGEPVTRTIAVRAFGLSETQLPDPLLPDATGVKQYAEPARDDTAEFNGEIVSIRVRDVSVIPTKAGTRTLPEVRLEWWDTVNDQARVASLPARTIEVLAKDGTAVAVTSGPGASSVPRQAGDEASAQAAFEPEAEAMSVFMLSVCGAGVLLGSLALVVLLRARRRRPCVARPSMTRPNGPSARAARSALKRACGRQDSVAASKALVDYARARLGDAALRTVGGAVLALGGPELKQAANSLNALRYAPEGGSFDGGMLWHAFEQARRVSVGESAKRKGPLPDLYPAK